MLAVEMIAHRGWWTLPGQRNTPEAFEAALRSGFGIETDIRDSRGTLVISHDMPRGGEQTFTEFLQQYNDCGSTATLALNIKADGLAAAVQSLLQQYDVTNYFCFDMSIPDSRGYMRLGMPVYARLSEIELDSPLVRQAPGVWLDAFERQWFGVDQIAQLLCEGKQVCVVSPELHGRGHQPLWDQLETWLDEYADHMPAGSGRLMLCTDLPDRFRVKTCV